MKSEKRFVVRDIVLDRGNASGCMRLRELNDALGLGTESDGIENTSARWV